MDDWIERTLAALYCRGQREVPHVLLTRGLVLPVVETAGNSPLAFSADGRLFATADSFSNDVTVSDVRTGRTVKKPAKGHRAQVDAAAFSVDGHTLTTVSGEDGTATFWTVPGA
ncbi:WD40 repeat domain-containing protein [Streptomyces griseorubiginosus]|uniref:WD40 repeat domain-containing protein n=1 Tax=Streptomyces griseorubiginosus TaxID=67304 RepID=UPI0036483576